MFVEIPGEEREEGRRAVASTLKKPAGRARSHSLNAQCRCTQTSRDSV